LGYEDLNDHDKLHHDPMLGVLVGRKDPTGRTRARKCHQPTQVGS
jgi:hypothetical protein